MSSVTFWSYVGYALAALFFLGSLAFGVMIYISSQTTKNNPIALPAKQAPVADAEEEDVFETEHFTQKQTGRRSAPVMHEPLKKSSSKNFFDDEDDFSITGGSNK